MNPSLDVQVRRPTARLMVSPSRIWIGVIVVAILGVLLVWFGRPWILWAYNIQRAGHYQATAITYPDPRYSDSLPLERDSAANDAALGHLAAAIQWRPDDAYAYRLAAESYMAKGEWLEAISVLETGSQQAGSDPLVEWDKVLSYEQLLQQRDAGPREALVRDFAEAVPDVDPRALTTPYCRSDDARSCYAARTTFELPYANSVYTETIQADTLFLHPPARVTIPLAVPAASPALSFLMGLDPQAKAWGTDGATFQIWVVEAEGGIIPVYQRTVNAADLTQGWVPGWVDLTPWAGQSVHIAVGTDAGSAANDTGDWVGWGNLALTDVRTAQRDSLLIESKIQTAFRDAHLSSAVLLTRGDEALLAQRYDEARRWYRRALYFNLPISSTLTYTDFVETRDRDGMEKAVPFLEQAVREDVGWSTAINRFYAFFNWGRWLADQEEYEDSEAAFSTALANVPVPTPIQYSAVSEAHRWMAIVLDAQDKTDEALEHAAEAVRLNSNSYDNQFLYGALLYVSNPTEAQDAETKFQYALALDSSASAWGRIILFWLENDQSERAFALCQNALQQYTPEQLGYVCWTDEEGSSTIFYQRYQEMLREGEVDTAYTNLEEAIMRDAGWRNAAERFLAWQTWFFYLFTNERYEEGVTVAEKAVEIIPPDFTAEKVGLFYARYATTLARLERYQDALPIFETALATQNSEFLYLDYADTLYHLDPGNIAVVRAAFAKAIASATDASRIRAQVIDYWYSAAEPEEAALVCDTSDGALESVLCAGDTTPSSGDYYRDYVAARESDDSDAMASALQQAITLDAGWQQLTFRYEGWYQWGTLQSDEENFSEAIDALQTAIEAADFKVQNVSLSDAYRNLGVAYVGTSELEEANEAFETSLSLNSDNIYTYLHYGKSLYALDNDNIRESQRLFEEALSRDPTNTALWTNILYFLQQEEQFSTLLAVCAKAGPEVQNVRARWCWNGQGEASRFAYGRFLTARRENNLTEAWDALEDAITVDAGWTGSDQQFDAWRVWGEHLLAIGDDGAIAAFEKALAVRPDDAPAEIVATVYVQYGNALEQVERFNDALDAYEQAQTTFPEAPWAYYYAGQALYELDASRTNEVRTFFDKSLDIAPDTVFLWQSVARFWLDARLADELTRVCGRASEDIAPEIEYMCWDGTGVPSVESYTLYLQQRNDNADAAYSALEQAITVDKGWRQSTEQYQAWRLWALHLVQTFDTEEERGAMQAALQRTIALADASTDPRQHSELYQTLALTYPQEQSAESIALLTQATETDPTNYWAFFYLGRALYLQDANNLPTTREQFETAITLLPDRLQIWSAVIAFWLDQSRDDDAREWCGRVPGALEDALDLQCWNGNTPSSTAYYNQYRATRTPDAAAYAALEQAITFDDGWSSANNRYQAWRTWGIYLASQPDRPEEAVTALEQALAIAPSNTSPVDLSEPYRYLGLSYAVLQQFEEALDALSKAVESNPNSIWAHVHYGKVLYSADHANKPQTVAEFDEALTLAPDSALVWENLITFWKLMGDEAERAALCERAAELPIATDLAEVCPAL